MRALAVLVLVAVGCAPTLQSQSSRLVSVEREPTQSCEWRYGFSAARRGDVIEVVALEQRECTSGEREKRTLEVTTEEYPDPVVLTLEATIAAAGVWVMAQPDECENRDVGCMYSGLDNFAGFLVAVPATIATAVDLFDFGSSTRTQVEYTRTQGATTQSDARARAGLPVRLVLQDGDTVRAITDARGRARLPIVVGMEPSGEYVEGELCVATQCRRVRFRP